MTHTLQVIRMLVTVLVVFIICWTPQQILVFYSAIYPEEYNQVKFTIIKLVARFLLNKNVYESESQCTLRPPEKHLCFWSVLCVLCSLWSLRAYQFIDSPPSVGFFFIQLTIVEVYPVIYLAYANSALNPLVYGGLNNNLRRRAAALLRKLCNCCTDLNRISPAGKISFSEIKKEGGREMGIKVPGCR